jgi:hypothetical protein
MIGRGDKLDGAVLIALTAHWRGMAFVLLKVGL